MSISIKNYKVLKETLLGRAHPLLSDLSIWCSTRFSKFKITSAYRENDPGVHGTLLFRGLDISSKSFEYPQEVVDEINEHWTYDPERLWLKCAAHHDTGSGFHIHLQVHPNTKYSGG